MNAPTLVVLANLALAAATSAQQFVTSPAGLLSTEGNTTFLHFTAGSASRPSDRRFQQIDASQTIPFVARSIGWRRDGGTNGGGTNEPPRTMDLEVTMGFADMTLLSQEFDANYMAGTRQVVFTKKSVNMPAWTGNAGRPAPFDFVVPLDVPFPYAPPLGLVIDFTHENVIFQGTATSGSSVDRDYVGASYTYGAELGTGCTPSSGSGPFTQAMRLENNGPALPRFGMRLRVDATDAPPLTPILMNIDLIDQNLTIPGLCTTLHAGAVASVLLGTSDAAGVLPAASLSFGHLPALVGVPLVTQLAALDPGQPVFPAVLSNGERATFPGGPSGTSNACLYHWGTLPATGGTLFFGGGIVMQIGI